MLAALLVCLVATPRRATRTERAAAPPNYSGRPAAASPSYSWEARKFGVVTPASVVEQTRGRCSRTAGWRPLSAVPQGGTKAGWIGGQAATTASLGSAWEARKFGVVTPASTSGAATPGLPFEGASFAVGSSIADLSWEDHKAAAILSPQSERGRVDLRRTAASADRSRSSGLAAAARLSQAHPQTPLSPAAAAIEASIAA